MRKRARIAIFPARGTKRRRACLRAWAVAILVSTWTGASGAAQADSFVLKSGEPIEGSMVQATRNTLIIRRAIGGMHQMPIQAIQEVRIDLAQGEQISGQLLSWADGVYQIRSGGEVVRISAGRILSRAPDRPEPSRTAPPPLRAPAAAKTAAAPRAQPAAKTIAAPRKELVETAAPSRAQPAVKTAAPSRAQPAVKTTAAPHGAPVEAKASPGEPVNAATSPGEGLVRTATSRDEPPVKTAAAPTLGARGISVAEAANGVVAGTPAVETAAADRAESDSRTLAVKASVDPAEASAAGVVFNIELSRPAEQTIVLIYGTVDGTARAGTDYEPQQGVIALAPGTRSTQVRVPLIDQRAGDDTRFELFLTADPKVVEITEPRITATIPGKD
jgi:RNase P/RNase MRP subunit p29